MSPGNIPDIFVAHYGKYQALVLAEPGAPPVPVQPNEAQMLIWMSAGFAMCNCSVMRGLKCSPNVSASLSVYELDEALYAIRASR